MELGAGRVLRCGAVPCLIGADGFATPVQRDNPDWAPFTAFLEQCPKRADLPTRAKADTNWLLAGYPVVEFQRPG